MAAIEQRASNLIWIFGDQHRAQALGRAGDANVSTPNIDALAAEGVTFEQAVSGSPLCCPYRGYCRGAIRIRRYPGTRCCYRPICLLSPSPSRRPVIPPRGSVSGTWMVFRSGKAGPHFIKYREKDAAVLILGSAMRTTTHNTTLWYTGTAAQSFDGFVRFPGLKVRLGQGIDMIDAFFLFHGTTGQIKSILDVP